MPPRLRPPDHTTNFSSSNERQAHRFAAQGCWLTGHDGSREMAKRATKEPAAANPPLAAIQKRDPRTSLTDTRTDPSDWKWDKSITADQLRKGDHFLIREQNAVPFDPNAGWKEGDMIPDDIVSREDAEGSAAFDRP